MLCSTVNLIKHNIRKIKIIRKIKAVFACFDCSIVSCTILLSCGIARPVIQLQAETGVTASAQVIRSGQ